MYPDKPNKRHIQLPILKDSSPMTPAHITLFVNLSRWSTLRTGLSTLLMDPVAETPLDATVCVFVDLEENLSELLSDMITTIRSHPMGQNWAPPRVNLVVGPNALERIIGFLKSADSLSDGLFLLVLLNANDINTSKTVVEACHRDGIPAIPFANTVETLEACVREVKVGTGTEFLFLWDIRPASVQQMCSELFAQAITHALSRRCPLNGIGLPCGVSAFFRTVAILQEYSKVVLDTPLCGCFAVHSIKNQVSWPTAMVCPYSDNSAEVLQGIAVCHMCTHASKCICCPVAASVRTGCPYKKLHMDSAFLAVAQEAYVSTRNCKRLVVLEHNWDYQYVPPQSTRPAVY